MLSPPLRTEPLIGSRCTPPAGTRPTVGSGAATYRLRLPIKCGYDSAGSTQAIQQECASDWPVLLWHQLNLITTSAPKVSSITTRPRPSQVRCAWMARRCLPTQSKYRCSTQAKSVKAIPPSIILCLILCLCQAMLVSSSLSPTRHVIEPPRAPSLLHHSTPTNRSLTTPTDRLASDHHHLVQHHRTIYMPTRPSHPLGSLAHRYHQANCSRHRSKRSSPRSRRQARHHQPNQWAWREEWPSKHHTEPRTEALSADSQGVPPYAVGTSAGHDSIWMQAPSSPPTNQRALEGQQVAAHRVGQEAHSSGSGLQNITAQVGRPAHMRCVVEALGDKVVSWIRLRDFHLLTIGSLTYIQDDRFVVRYGGPHTNDWALTIKHVTIKDEGLYECQINSDPPRSQYFYLHVVVPLSEIVGNPDIFVGEPINLTCLISQSPEPPAFVFWYHNERMINFDYDTASKGQISVQKSPHQSDVIISRLLIQRALLDDSGNYTCSPSNAEPASTYVHVLQGERRLSNDIQNDWSQTEQSANNEGHHSASRTEQSARRLGTTLLLFVFLLTINLASWA